MVSTLYKLAIYCIGIIHTHNVSSDTVQCQHTTARESGRSLQFKIQPIHNKYYYRIKTMLHNCVPSYFQFLILWRNITISPQALMKCLA